MPVDHMLVAIPSGMLTQGAVDHCVEAADSQCGDDGREVGVLDEGGRHDGDHEGQDELESVHQLHIREGERGVLTHTHTHTHTERERERDYSALRVCWLVLGVCFAQPHTSILQA